LFIVTLEEKDDETQMRIARDEQLFNAIGIRDGPTAYRSLWQNAYVDVPSGEPVRNGEQIIYAWTI